MTRLILLGLIIWLAIYVLKRVINQSNTRQSDTSEANDSEGKNLDGEQMVQCATCNVHLPRSEAFLVNSNFYCCKAHIPNT